MPTLTISITIEARGQDVPGFRQPVVDWKPIDKLVTGFRQQIENVPGCKVVCSSIHEDKSEAATARYLEQANANIDAERAKHAAELTSQR